MSEQGEDSLPAPTRTLSQVSRWLRGFQAVCFVVAGLSHARDMWQGGWLPYDYGPLPVNVFSTTLVVWDPLVMLLRSRATNSLDVCSEPAAHLVVGPSPIEGVSVTPVVFRP
jgi:hypothetical protein